MTRNSAAGIERPGGAASLASSVQPPVEIILNLDQDVVDKFKATGPNWRERMEAVLSAEAIQ